MNLFNRMSFLKCLALICFIMTASIGIQAQGQFRALVFSKTQGFRHQSIPNAVKAIKNLANDRVFSVYTTEDATVFTDESLKKYDLIILASTTGNILNDEQKEAFKKFVQSGKGVVGIHSATDTEYEWEWYTKMIGGQFKHHPAQQTVKIDVVDQDHPSTYHLAKKWLWTDELYEYQNFNEDVHILLQLDENTYDTGARNGKKMGMGAVHPIAWCHEYDGGRVFYTGLGHVESAYKDPDFLNHLYGGIWWAAKGYPLK
ncbi:ThuA domain-containing protein [Echinicola sp. CAU 1574]|uniref:ThuA domain-containing protein n=2 Tax=Echinicola arenosa TaxID=2774144 RepID=A0ABR9AH52_9BACT|nr:ThuA domain-containing protein [Echinicola arenosa]